LELRVRWIGTNFLVRADMAISERFAAKEVASFRGTQRAQVVNHPPSLLELFLRLDDGGRRDAAERAVVPAPE
jgi:hypothetical protein